MIIDRQKIEKDVRVYNLLRTDFIESVIVHECKPVLEYFNLTIGDLIVSYSSSGTIEKPEIFVFIQLPNNDRLYDAYMSSKHSYISDVKGVTYSKTKHLYLTVQKVKLRIIFSGSCSLQEEDVYVLRMLGKVKPSSETTFSEHVVCEVN